MPSPPPAPRRARAAAAAPPWQPSRQVQDSFDSSAEIITGPRNAVAGPSHNNGIGSSSFTFADSRATPAMLPTRHRAMPKANLFPESEQLISRLAGKRGRARDSASSEFSMDLNYRPSSADQRQIALPPGAPGPSRTKMGAQLHPRVSNSSSFAASPRRGAAAGRGSELFAPSTPTGAKSRFPGYNMDGSSSVVGDLDEANNSGLLDLGPQSLRFPFRGATASRSSPQRSSGLDDSRLGPPVTRSKRGSSEAANGSIIEHSLSEVLETDEPEEDGPGPVQRDGHLLHRLRLWRQDAMEHHLYDTAIFWGEKIVCMEADPSQRPNDAYFLAKAYFLTHQYGRAEHLLTVPLPPINRPVTAESSQQDGPAAEDGEVADEDALQAALNASHKNSALPESLLKRSSARPGIHAGTLQPRNGMSSRTGFQSPIHEGMDEDVNAIPPVKRKEREFTVSGTGTGSESNGGDGDSDGSGDKVKEEPPSIDALPKSERTDFRLGPNKASKDRPPPPSLAIPEDVYQAWTKEQNEAFAEVCDHSRRLKSDAAHGDDPSALPLAEISAACRLLAAKCMVRLGKFGEALELIGEESGRWVKGGGKYGYATPSSDGLLKVSSSVAHLRGLIQLRLDNLDAAREAFLEALRLDVKNYDAYSALVDGRLLSGQAVWRVIETLQWQAQSDGDEQSFDFIKMCYTAKMGKEDQANAIRAASARRELWNTYGGGSEEDDCTNGLYNSPDLLYSLAEDLHARRRFTDALVVTSHVLSLDAQHDQTLDLHISSIASLSTTQAKIYRPQLFLLANRLVEEHPELATSWFAVGTWYSTSSRWVEARKYFSKATLLNPRHLPSWLSFAHSFSLEGESEQAVLAYSSVVRNFPTDRYAKVCLGAEHLRMGNLKMARIFLEGAREGEGSDAGLGEEEVGLLCYYEGRWDEAITLFERFLAASSAAKEPDASHITTRLNLAWTYGKAKREEEAREMFASVIQLDPENVSGYLGLAMVDHSLGRVGDAIGWYHECLALDPRHPQATELMQVAMDEYAELSLQESAGTEGFPPPLEVEMTTTPAHRADGPGLSGPDEIPLAAYDIDDSDRMVEDLRDLQTSDSIFVEGGNGSASVLRRMQQDRREDGQEPSQSISRGTAEANGSMMASGSISGQQGRSLGEDQSTDMDETG